jgi:hypothetical protein
MQWRVMVVARKTIEPPIAGKIAFMEKKTNA